MPEINVSSHTLSLLGALVGSSCVQRKSSMAPGECVGASVSVMGYVHAR